MGKYLDKNGLLYLWGRIREALTGKQDKLTGAAGQVVGFDAAGNAVAQDAAGSVTMQQVNEAIQEAVLDSWEGSY